MKQLKELYEKLLIKLYEGKFYENVLVVCNEKIPSKYVAYKIEGIVRKLKGKTIYYKANQMFVKTIYGYLHIVFDSAYNPQIYTGRKNYKAITSTEIDEYIHVLKPKAAFKAIFKKGEW